MKNSIHNPFNITGLDQPIHAWVSQFTGWLSPSAFLLSYSDWLLHLGNSVEKWLDVSQNATQHYTEFMLYVLRSFQHHDCEPCIEARPTDKRFQSDLWKRIPFNFYAQLFLVNEKIWNEVTTNVRGLSKHHENLVNFSTRQILDIFSPSNFAWLNPDVLDATIKNSGMNFINGFNNWIEDITLYINKQPPVGTEKFLVGKDVAITPGKIIFRNHLIELIQYTSSTQKVYAEPILIVPAWIMKYYILDLSPTNSMVKYLVDQGHTVFMISWRNPTSEDRDLGMEDYVNSGILSAIDSINQIIPKQKMHAVGYCIGGTLLMITAAYMAKKKDDRLKSITLFAAQIDFKDAGELLLFIDESQLTYLEDIMWEKGYLDGLQMAGAFSMLNSIDLIWSRIILDYLLGERRPINDLMAWDYDTTRMPYKMHSEYLRNLFLNNALVEGHYKINNITLSLLDIDVPMFVVSTLRDHVAPWKSVYKVHTFTATDITYVLTNGGHNSGVVNEPGHSGRSFQLLKHKKEDKYHSPEHWQDIAPQIEGSWWPMWEKWLANFSGEKISPPELGNPTNGIKIICDAPGTYVFQK